MATKRLTEHHPFMKKVNELSKIMDEMGIRIDNNSMGGLNIVDTNTNQSYRLKDMESGEMQSDFPYFTEFKLTFEI
jgi:hypothetical protein